MKTLKLVKELDKVHNQRRLHQAILQKRKFKESKQPLKIIVIKKNLSKHSDKKSEKNPKKIEFYIKKLTESWKKRKNRGRGNYKKSSDIKRAVAQLCSKSEEEYPYISKEEKNIIADQFLFLQKELDSYQDRDQIFLFKTKYNDLQGNDSQITDNTWQATWKTKYNDLQGNDSQITDNTWQAKKIPPLQLPQEKKKRRNIRINNNTKDSSINRKNHTKKVVVCNKNSFEEMEYWDIWNIKEDIKLFSFINTSKITHNNEVYEGKSPPKESPSYTFFYSHYAELNTINNNQNSQNSPFLITTNQQAYRQQKLICPYACSFVMVKDVDNNLHQVSYAEFEKIVKYTYRFSNKQYNTESLWNSFLNNNKYFGANGYFVEKEREKKKQERIKREKAKKVEKDKQMELEYQEKEKQHLKRELNLRKNLNVAEQGIFDMWKFAESDFKAKRYVDFVLWVKLLEVTKIKNNEIFLLAPNTIIKNKVMENYLTIFTETIKKQFSENINIVIEYQKHSEGNYERISSKRQLNKEFASISYKNGYEIEINPDYARNYVIPYFGYKEKKKKEK